MHFLTLFPGSAAEILKSLELFIDDLKCMISARAMDREKIRQNWRRLAFWLYVAKIDVMATVLRDDIFAPYDHATDFARCTISILEEGSKFIFNYPTVPENILKIVENLLNVISGHSTEFQSTADKIR